MARAIARRLSFANVMSVIAVFIALGGTAFAFSLGKNSVGSKQIKANAVTAAKLKKNAVTGAKIKDSAVSGAKVADGSLTGADINQGTLTSVRAGNITTVSMDGDGTCTIRKPVAGVTATHVGTGGCNVDFGRDVSTCDAVATVDVRLLPNQVILLSERSAFVIRSQTNPNLIDTRTFVDSGGETPSDLGVTLVVIC